MSSESADRDARTEAWTIARVLKWATDDFKSRGFDSARLDAELLLSEALGCDRVRLITDNQRELENGALGRFRALIKRRRTGEPIAYILGRREFHGLPFRVDRRVLVPRPDTETLVEVALERTRDRYMYGRMLDLCTGSGCVAIAFAKERPTWHITALDVSPEAIEVAIENAIRLGTIFGMRFGVGELTAPLSAGDRFELITANPPYIPSADIQGLDPAIRDFEPRIALEGGADGLAVVNRIVELGVPLLAPGGVLAVEVQHDQATRVAERFEALGLCAIARKRDYGGHERVVSGRRA